MVFCYPDGTCVSADNSFLTLLGRILTHPKGIILFLLPLVIGVSIYFFIRKKINNQLTIILLSTIYFLLYILYIYFFLFSMYKID
jgi:hypothetical protein